MSQRVRKDKIKNRNRKVEENEQNYDEKEA